MPTINGTAGNDTLIGTSDNDTIYSFGGNDSIDAGSGNDVIFDQGGAFGFIDAGSGDDVVTVNLQSTSSGQVTTILGGTGYDGLEFGMGGPGSAIIDMGEGGDNILLTATPGGGTTITLGDSADFKGRKVEVSRFKGLGEMNPDQLKEITMDPASRSLIRITLPGEFQDRQPVKDLVERLMGKNPEHRFNFIQNNAANLSEDEIDA